MASARVGVQSNLLLLVGAALRVVHNLLDDDVCERVAEQLGPQQQCHPATHDEEPCDFREIRPCNEDVHTRAVSHDAADGEATLDTARSSKQRSSVHHWQNDGQGNKDDEREQWNQLPGMSEPLQQHRHALHRP
eukprot:CAMPEP_0171107312 /NCGR_PEP_ID=MMETSP0766_2-20121228/66530_1 /TAXON_ID=439317 /ORGANISM="Gambierdiscus australes, Strain CAWD 149" /LENGTH=133 /DNA_ID=CAMNT_0011568585 /DNA_START=47 /DNA_END=445 /DNA_ORIENTATION=+